MSDQQMPARIWRDLFVSENDDIHCKLVEFIRSDIAERMAEALERSRVDLQAAKIVIESYKNASTYGIIQTLEIVDAALSAFRSATQDTEARHE